MPVTKVKLTEIQKAISNSFDLLICSSSFEERCISIPTSIDIQNIRRVLILSNLDYSDYVDNNQRHLSNYFGNRAHVVGVRSSDPIVTADAIGQCLKDAVKDGCAENILIDVTALTHETLLILLRLLRLICHQKHIVGTYANASAYSIGDDVKYKWLSRGIGEVRSVLGYPGQITPARKTHLILIVGYEHERAAGLIDSIEPSSIALGYGRSGSATTEKDKDANEHYTHLVNQMVTSFSDIRLFEIPCDDPYGTCNKLREEIGKAGDVNIVIAPMNNKLSTIGAAWAAFENDKIQICYAKALSYNYFNYSLPGSYCYIVDM